MRLLNWLKKPYFFIKSPKANLLLAFGVGFFVFLFLFVFKPFGISNINNNFLYYTLGFGLVTFIIQSSFYLLLPFIFKDYYKDENWKVGKNILFLFLLVFTISLGNYYYNSIVQNTDNMSVLSLKEFFIYTFSIAVFPITIFTYLSEKLYRKVRQKNSEEIMKLKASKVIRKTNERIKIFGENNKEYITFNLDNLVYITSQGNYASFYLNEEKGIEEKTIRNTLINISEELKEKTNIIRCHKSYIINSKFMNTIYGNARGYYLESNIINKKIPVSRSFKKQDLKKLIF